MSTTGTFIVISRAGARRDLSRGAREQPYWDEHGAFVDDLVDEGFIVMGGPLVDEGGAMLVVRADGEVDIRAKLEADPWYEHGILQLERIARWDIFIDHRARPAPGPPPCRIIPTMGKSDQGDLHQPLP